MNLAPLSHHAADGRFKLPEDDLYHVVPLGEYPHAESKTIQVVDARSIDSMFAAYNREAAKPNFTGLRIDQEHFSYDTEKSSEAFGWITGLVKKADGLWAKIRWTDLGDTALKNGRYRFASPVWLSSDIEWLDALRVRPLRMDSVGLTNKPNLTGIIPLTNRSGSSADTSVDETARAKRAEIKVQEFKLANHCSYVEALNAVRRASPELFGLPAPAYHGFAQKLPLPNRSASNADEAARAKKAEAKVQEFNLANRCAYVEALNAVRRASPELFGLPASGPRFTNKMATDSVMPWDMNADQLSKLEAVALPGLEANFVAWRDTGHQVSDNLQSVFSSMKSLRDKYPTWDFARAWQEVEIQKPAEARAAMMVFAQT